MDERIDKYRPIPEALAAGGKVNIGTIKINKMIGDLYALIMYINLMYILDIPDFFWEKDIHESDYVLNQLTTKYLEITNRLI